MVVRADGRPQPAGTGLRLSCRAVRKDTRKGNVFLLITSMQSYLSASAEYYVNVWSTPNANLFIINCNRIYMQIYLPPDR